MKKRQLFFVSLTVIIILFALSFYFFFSSRQPGREALPSVNDIPRYEIEGEFFPETGVFSGKEMVYYKNNEGEPLKELLFHIYPNAFNKEETAPFTAEEFELAYPEGFSWGGIAISRVLLDGVPAVFKTDGTILAVNLNGELNPDREVKVYIEFKIKLPKSPGRFGYFKDTYNFGNWYPILCVYDKEGWHKDPYYKIGDPFYSDIAYYNFTLYAPAEYILATTGEIVEQKEEKGKKKWVVKTGPVRDFAFVMSKEFKIKETYAGKTRVMSYYFKEDEENSKKALEAARKAINYFSEAFGPYIYSTYSVVAADFYMGGMEYPNLVLIDRNLYKDGLMLEYVIAHETAHQWWYGMVGNDEVKEPWLDEAVTEYSTILYFEKHYGKRQGSEIYENFILNPYKFYQMAKNTGPIMRPLSEFTDWREYDAAVYKKGAIMLKELEKRISKPKMIKALNVYYHRNLLRNSTVEEFIRAINDTTGTDFRELIFKMLREEKELNLAA